MGSIRRWTKDNLLVKSLYERMQEIPDPRCERKKVHNCAEILTYLVIGYLCGRTAIRRALSWASAHESILRKYMKITGGIASAPTVSRLLRRIDEEIFALTFTDWITQVLGDGSAHIIIDGKALRAATEKIRDSSVPYILNAIEAATGIVIAQLPIDAKTNEITAIPQMLDRIDLHGNMVTIDAIGTQNTIMEKLDKAGAGFLLQVKKNQPQMYEDIITFFEELEGEAKKEKENPEYHSPLKEQIDKCSHYRTDEKNRERYEHREYSSCNYAGCLHKREEMPCIQTVGYANQVRRLIVKDKDGEDITPDLKTFIREGSVRQQKPVTGDRRDDAIQKVGLVSNRKLTAREMGELKREHWIIENSLHHVLDDVFREDRSPAKGSKNNLALIRKIAYNIIRYALATLPGKKSVITMMDEFADHPETALKYIFEPLRSLH